MTIIVNEVMGADAAPPEDVSPVARSALFIALLLLIWVGLEPFPDRSAPSPEVSGAPDFVYHLIALTLTGLSFAVAFPILRGVLPSLSRVFIVLLLWIVVSIATSLNVRLSAVRFVVTLSDIALGMTILFIPRGVRDFSRLLTIVTGGILVVCYLGVLLIPSLSIHQITDAGLAAELEGNWRGIFSHKNLAGTMMAISIIIALFVARSGQMIAGVAIGFGAAIFLVMSQSKNAIGLLPVTLLLALGVECVKPLWARLSIALGPLLLLNVLTVGTVYSEAVKRLVDQLPGDPTFTGRTDIWAFVADRIAERPIFGHGFRAFWHTDTVLNAAEFGNNKWVAEMVHSHNGYLDLALTMGLPGLAIGLAVFLIYPVLDYHRHLTDPPNDLLATLFLRLWMFLMYSMTFESFLFERGIASWYMTLMAVFGLRYVAKMRVSP